MTRMKLKGNDFTLQKILIFNGTKDKDLFLKDNAEALRKS